MLFREMVAVYYENHTKSINTHFGQNDEFIFMLKRMVQIVITVLKGLRWIYRK
jgi:hypothetical protein